MPDPTLDISGYVQITKETFAQRQSAHYVELHGTMLYYWNEKPRGGAGQQQPVSVFNIEKAELEEPPSAKLDVVLRGPHLAKPVTLRFPAEREKKEWMAKLKAPVAAHSKVVSVQQSQEELQRQQDDRSVTIFTRAGHKKVCLDDFEMVRVLGEGAFGQVLQVTKKDTGEQFAMKKISKRLVEESTGGPVPVERSILETLHHPFIVALHFAFQTEESLYIVMDLLAGGELFHHLEVCGTFDEPRARFYIAEIALAIGYLHSNGIIYRDLKPENVVLDADGHACLTDFGLAKANIVNGATANTFCGTAEYQAPEFLLGNPHDRAVDWWSLGIMLYEMLFGIPPFFDENTTTMSELIIEGDLTFDKNNRSVSPHAEDLIRHLLDRDPSTRLQLFEDFKKHPFFNGLDFDELYQRKVTPPFIPDADTRNNFNADFTELALPVEEHNPDHTHPNVAGFTYDRADEALRAAQPVLPSPAPKKAPGPRRSSAKSSGGDGNSGGSAAVAGPAAPASPLTRKSSTSKPSSVASNPKSILASPTSAKKAPPPAGPAPHRVPKLPPPKRSSQS